MRQYFTLACALTLGVLSVFGTGKGDQVRATNVFDGKLLSSISQGRTKLNISYNDNNQLTSAGFVKFDYRGGEKDGFAYDVMFSEKDEDETIEMYFKLNDQLFAAEVYQIEKEIGEPTTYEKWFLEYNSEGQLCKAASSFSQESYVLTYENGNITRVVVDEPYEYDSDTYEIYYPDNLANTSGFMMFDELFSVDLGDMEIAYYAGILGKPTRCLPQKKYDQGDRYSDIYKWTLDTEGYPTKISFDGEYLNFKWTEAVGINGVVIDPMEDGPQEYFNINGIRMTQPNKGLNIIRHSNGKVSKMIIP